MNADRAAVFSALSASLPQGPGGGGSQTKRAPSGENTGRWTKEEHTTFLQGLELHGKEWKKIASMIDSRTVVQIRTHAQKYFQKLAKAAESQGHEVPGDLVSTASSLRREAAAAAAAGESTRRRGKRGAAAAAAAAGPVSPQGRPQGSSRTMAAQLCDDMDSSSSSDSDSLSSSVASPSSASAFSSDPASSPARGRRDSLASAPDAAPRQASTSSAAAAAARNGFALNVRVPVFNSKKNDREDVDQELDWLMSGVSGMRMPHNSPTAVEDLEMYADFGAADGVGRTQIKLFDGRNRHAAQPHHDTQVSQGQRAQVLAEQQPEQQQGQQHQQQDGADDGDDADSLDEWLSGAGSDDAAGSASEIAERDEDLFSVLSDAAPEEEGLAPQPDLAAFGPLAAFVFDKRAQLQQPDAKRRRLTSAA